MQVILNNLAVALFQLVTQPTFTNGERKIICAKYVNLHVSEQAITLLF